MITAQEPTTNGMSGRVAAYYDLLYADKDFQAEADYVASLLDRYGDCPRSILGYGSRTGKCELALAEMGYEVTGLTPSRKTLAAADILAEGDGSHRSAAERKLGRMGLPARLDGSGEPSYEGSTFPVEGAAERNGPHPNLLPAGEGSRHDAVILLDRLMSYHTRESDLLAVFDNVALHLKAGGIFVFDVWYGPAVLAQHLETRVQRVADERVELTCITEPHLCSEWNCIQLVYTLFVRDKRDGRIRELSEMHSMRYFTIPEIKTIANCRGFDIVRAERWLAGQLPCTDTRGVCFVLRKR